MHFYATCLCYYFSYSNAEKSENIKSELTEQLISYQLSKIINKLLRMPISTAKFAYLITSQADMHLFDFLLVSSLNATTMATSKHQNPNIRL
jgi:hypothetical protein